MPRKAKTQGAGIKEVLGKINAFLKKTKIVSNVAGIIPHPISQAAANVARNSGYGKKKGKGVRLPGSGVSLPGAGKKKRKTPKKK